MRRALTFLTLTVLMLASCHRQGAMLSQKDAATADSLAWHVAVLPVMDCLPVYYASERGLFDSLGLDVRLLAYQSMMDADTALVKGHAQAGYSALPRLLQLAEDSAAAALSLQPLALCHGTYWLVTGPKSKIKKVEKMQERMVALSRNNLGDWWSDQLMEQKNMERSDIFRPQINDVALRLKMVTDDMVDAAILPMPQAFMAKQAGCRVLSQLVDSLCWMNCMAVPTFAADDTLRHQQQELFLLALDSAAVELNQHPDSSVLCSILTDMFAVTDTLAGLVPLPRFHKAKQPDDAQRATVKQWLDSRTLKQ